MKTAYQWMYKLGFRPQEYSKTLYFDGHERADVIESRKKYLKQYPELRSQSRVYFGDQLELSTPVDLAVLKDDCQTVFVYHDESTVHAKERPRLSWLLPGTSELRSKDRGRLIHISDFICETTGRLVITEDRAQIQNPVPSVTDAAVVIYPGTKGDPWWDMNQLINQVKTQALPIFEAMHPSCQGVFIFDCSSAHEAYGPSALRVQNMNMSPGGKRGHLRSTAIPSDDPNIPSELRGLPQAMIFSDDHPDIKLRGQPKGIKVVLQERGLWEFYTKKTESLKIPPLIMKCSACKTSGINQDAQNRAARVIQEEEARGYFMSDQECGVQEILGTDTKDCCWSKILSLQSDFVNEKPLLQMVIEEAGHVCLFLPKFHCELNPIELLWSYIKDGLFLFYASTCSAKNSG